MAKSPSDKPIIIVPTDVEGSWHAMLAIYDRLEKTNNFFEWSSEEDFSRPKALKSKPMAELLRQLSQLPVRDSFRVGIGLFGVGLLLPFDETREMWDGRMVALHITLDRQIEVCLLDMSVRGLTRPVIKSTICDLQNAVEQVVNFAALLPGTRIPAPDERPKSL